MISPELIRRYPFFAGLNHHQILDLAMVADVVTVEVGDYFFREGDNLKEFFLVVDGSIDITISVTDRSVAQNIIENILGNFITKEITVSTIGPGQIFGWSALIPPHTSTATARAARSSRVVAFDGEQLRHSFQDDCNFGYLMLQIIAGVVRQRLRDMHIQSLAFVPG